MEKAILDLIEDEVTRRVHLRMSVSLEMVSRLYDIPLERLIKDTSGLEVTFCKGILRNGKRCLKNPQPCGYCKFHLKQMPGGPPSTTPTPPEPVPSAPWDS